LQTVSGQFIIRPMSNSALTLSEKRSVLALDAAMRPRLDADAFRAAAAASRAAHGARHEHVKMVALKCSARQIANWKHEVAAS
jgi:hypothetical protein